MADPKAYEYDIGDDAKELGLFFIFARYIFPFLFSFLIGVLGIVFVAYLLREFVPLIVAYPAFPPPQLPQAPQVWLSGLFR